MHRSNQLAVIIVMSALVACSPSSPRITVEWTTASEINSAGFNLYRSASADGEYAKINNALIPASPDPVIGGKYRYEDTMVEPGKTYYYQLEEVELNGVTKRYGPISNTAPLPWYTDTRVWVVSAIALAVFAGFVWSRRKKIPH